VDLPHRLQSARSENSLHLVAASVEDHQRRPELGNDQPRFDTRRSENARRFGRAHHQGSERPRNLRHHFHHRAVASRREHHLDRIRRRAGLHHARRRARIGQTLRLRHAGVHSHQHDRSVAHPIPARLTWRPKIIRPTIAPYAYRTDDYGATWTKIVNGIPNDDFVQSIREDPKRRGLLYAGTEHGIYVSFDDGLHWRSLLAESPGYTSLGFSRRFKATTWSSPRTAARSMCSTTFRFCGRLPAI
jgi:hypothetical protein